MTEVQLVDVALVVALIPLLTAIGELLKKTFKLDPDVVPAINVVIGVLLAVLWVGGHPSQAPTEGRWGVALLTGLVAGLASASLYDVATRVLHNGKPPAPPAEKDGV